MSPWIVPAVVFGVLAIWVCYDLLQKKHAIIRNFPIIGHFRYWLEAIGPELRQYIVTSNNEERPFSRDERRWVYASSKKENNYFGFGTDNDLEQSPNFLVIKHAPFPINDAMPSDERYDDLYRIPSAKVLGAPRGRKHAFRLPSIINVSAMSFGSLSAPAVEALNRGCQISESLQNTGEGGISPHHTHGGALIWQIGTGYFGCRNADGGFDESRFVDTVERHNVRAIEIKLSQGAKPGRGGVLPAAKITKEIAEIRGIPLGKDCISPSSHREFHDVDSLLDFVERLADLTGRPVGIKSAVGELEFWTDLAIQMKTTGRGVDYIAIDGGEGGTGAAPLTFTDHVALPFKLGFARVHDEFVKQNLHQQVMFFGAGKLGFPERALAAMALGCDAVYVAREPMLAIGCIQAQKCHSGHCPTGVATQNKWLIKGLDPTHKAARLANYVVTLRKEILQLSHACGFVHPSLVPTNRFEILDECFQARPLDKVFHMSESDALPSPEDCATITKLMASTKRWAAEHSIYGSNKPHLEKVTV
ncbi:MAG: FMN-binding glutamate synthase family protein [Planctomycetales bacterium]|nr:FMN-binding glutamate synthase family protein [Planctomycetales bacterium]